MSITRTQYVLGGTSVFLLLMAIMPISIHFGGIPFADKIVHAIASGLLTFTLIQFISIRKAILIAFLLFTGAELIQMYLPQRQASIDDALANCVGILIVWIYAIVRK